MIMFTFKIKVKKIGTKKYLSFFIVAKEQITKEQNMNSHGHFFCPK